MNLLNVLGNANVTGELKVGTGANFTINQTGITFADGTQQITAAGGGAWQFVSGTAITNLRFMNFTSFETGYDYSISIQGAIPATDAVTLEARLSQSSTWLSTATDYEDGAPNSSISLIAIGNSFGNAADEGFNMEINLPEPNVASRVKRVIATVAGSDESNNETQKGIAGGRLDVNTNAVNGISLFFSSGNWSANGKIYVFRKKLSAGAAVTISSSIWNDSGTNIYPSVLTRKIGIGTSSPSSLFETGRSAQTNEVNLSNILFVNSTSGNVSIGTAIAANTLKVVGDVNITDNLFVGGNLTFYNADYAELFESDVELEKGDVVCLDEKNKISKCTKRADMSVIGAVSSNPSIVGRNLGFKKSYPVGMVGIVPVKVTGPVNRFELLTTSSKQGFAEKATYKDFGSIIGKSMNSCYKDKCLIDVIVGLK